MLKDSPQLLDRWIDQFHFEGRRSMSAAELRHLSLKLQEATKPTNVIVIGISAMAAVVLFLICGLGRIDHRLFGPLLALSIVLTSIVPLQWIRQIQAYRENLGDIQAGEVEVFEASNESWIVFLPKSGRLLTQDGKYTKGEVYLKVHGIASKPALDSSPFPAQFTWEENHFAPVRVLSELEKQELASLLPARKGWKWLFPMILWGWTLIGICDLDKFGFSYINLLRTVLVGATATSLSSYLLYRRFRVQRVKSDLKRGTVICERTAGYDFEHLENSELLWTVDANPASWRKRTNISWLRTTI